MNMIAPYAAGFAELRSGSLGVRLAAGPDEVDAAQALRYQVFFEEMGATADPQAQALRRDRDGYDAVADHLVVIDHDRGGVVATYRLIRAEAAADAGGFYSEAEFDISALRGSGERLLELGRSCVHRDYRSGRAMQLLWRGLAAYIALHGIDVMFGCASLPGTDPAALGGLLGYLHQAHLAPVGQRPLALAARHVAMTAFAPADAATALAGLPPLIKGYLRLGGWVGDGAVVDAEFNTVDIAIVVRTAAITARYLRHYDGVLRPI